MRHLTLAALIFAIAAPAFAEARLSQNGLRVEFEGSQYEVFTKAGWSPSGLFCAVGNVARGQGAAANDILVVTRGVGASPTRPNRRSASFELVERSEAQRRGFFNITAGFGVGLSKSVGAAIFACSTDDRLRRGR